MVYVPQTDEGDMPDDHDEDEDEDADDLMWSFMMYDHE